MIAPEVWYEHQRNYQHYGFDMKPERQRGTRVEPRKRARRVAVSSVAGKKAVFVTVLSAAVAMIMLIIITAYAANLRFDINSKIKENQALMGEIENLQVELCGENNVNYIERKAVKELKMIYPADGDKVYIASDYIQDRGFADIIKDKAYN